MLTANCDSVPLLAPTESMITLSTSRTVLPIDGEAVVTATIVEQSGTPVHNGTLVRFTTTLGTLDPAEARTNSGAVTARLLAGRQSGTAEIGAISGSAVAETIEVQIGGAAAAAVVLNASPGSIPSTGGTVTLVATVTDESGNRLPGVPVSFTATAGTLGATSVVTDTFGEATTTITTDRETAVTASAGGESSPTTTITVTTAPAATLSVTTTTPTAGQATAFSVVVTVGSLPLTDVTIDFGDGQTQTLAAAAGTSTPTHIYQTPGAYVATVTVRDTGGEATTVSTTVIVLSPGPLNVTLSTIGTLQVNEIVTFTASVTGLTTTIDRYDWSFGDGSTTTTTGNITQHVYTSSGIKTASVTVSGADGSTGTAVISINVLPATPLEVTVGVSPAAPTAGATVTFTASVTGNAGSGVTSYVWNFGDGQGRTTNGNITSHVYAASANRTVTVTVTAPDGRTATTSIQISVS